MERGIILICLLFVVVINLSSVMAIRINEVELNPAGDDSGNEWVELYSEGEIDLQDWKLINGDDGVFYLDGSFKGFYIVEFPSQWLDNKDEKVILKDSENKTIDKTDLFADSSNNDKTWQFCETWIFEISTEDDENNCPEEEKLAEEEPKEKNETLAEDEAAEENNEAVEEKTQEKTTEEAKKIAISTAQTSETEQTGEVIRLGNRKAIEEDKDASKNSLIYQSATELMKRYGIYAFCLLLIVIIIILSFRIRKIKKQNI